MASRLIIYSVLFHDVMSPIVSLLDIDVDIGVLFYDAVFFSKMLILNAVFSFMMLITPVVFCFMVSISPVSLCYVVDFTCVSL